jgi:hypothetical protein
MEGVVDEILVRELVWDEVEREEGGTNSSYIGPS